MERVLTAIILTLTLSACSSTSNNVEQKSLSVYERKILKEDQLTNEILAKTALLSSKSLAVFVRTEQAAKQPELTAEQIRQARFQAEYIPVNMEQKVEYAWDSAPEPLLFALASNAGYELDYMNQRPPIPKTVKVSSELRMIKTYIDIIEQQTRGYIEKIERDDKSARKVIRVYYSAF